MAMTNVELYEALKRSIPEDAARMIAEAFHPAKDLATKQDLAEIVGEMRSEFAAVRGEMREGFARLQGEIHKSSASTMRWMLTFFIPVWAGTWGTVVAVVLKG